MATKLISALGRAVVFAAVLVSAAVVVPAVAPTEASAQSRSLQEGPVVRRQLLYRSARFELVPALGSAIGPVYQRELFLAVTGRYHLNNSLAVGLNANAGLLALDTSIASNYETADPLGSRQLYYAKQTALLDLHLAYSLFSGKTSLIGGALSYLDLYVAIGGGGALLTADSVAEDLGGFRFGPAVSVGLRVFFMEQFALNLRFSDYLYSSAYSQRVVAGVPPRPQEVDERFRSHFIGTLGVSIFFPGEVRVSR